MVARNGAQKPVLEAHCVVGHCSLCGSKEQCCVVPIKCRVASKASGRARARRCYAWYGVQVLRMLVALFVHGKCSGRSGAVL